MSERLNKTSICSVIFLDIVSYSQKPVSEQIELKNRFNQLISDAIRNIAQNDRIILDTGDGAAISLLGAPEEALFVSLTIRDGILMNNHGHSDEHMEVRIGINLGPVRVVKDINNHLNIIGDGINVAQRVMSFAEPNQILVSRSYYEVVCRLTTEFTHMFSYSGVKHDKHVREHEVYVIQAPSEEPPSATTPSLDSSVADGPRLVPLPGKKTIAAMIAAVAALVLLAVFMLPRKPQLTIESLPQTPSNDIAPAAGEAKAIPISSSESLPSVPESQPNKTAKAEPLEKKPASGGSEKPAKPKPKKLAAKKTEPKAETQQAQHEKPAQQEKSGWEKFTDSVKRGTEKPSCTDAQRSLGQCN